ncbi:hypothetical protein LTR15_006476 [Elasticomyces elasticus]|nr:hypothetical protein LTR15_006476 [Elasticomyces elasticus]
MQSDEHIPPPHQPQAHKTMSTPTLPGLPPELRNRILELVVVDPLLIQASRPSPRAILKTSKEGIMPQQPAITQVNHQIRDEALPIFYGQNLFWIPHSRYSDPPRPKAWSQCFGNIEAVKHANHIFFAVAMCDSKWVDFEVETTKAGKVDCKSHGSAGNLCLCGVQALLSAPDVRSIANILQVLEEDIVPSLKKAFSRSRNSDLAVQVNGIARDTSCRNRIMETTDRGVVHVEAEAVLSERRNAQCGIDMSAER